MPLTRRLRGAGHARLSARPWSSGESYDGDDDDGKVRAQIKLDGWNVCRKLSWSRKRGDGWLVDEVGGDARWDAKAQSRGIRTAGGAATAPCRWLLQACSRISVALTIFKGLLVRADQTSRWIHACLFVVIPLSSW